MSNPTDPVIVRHDRILGGRPVFRGTRVQVELLFENLAEGYSVDEIIENFPTLDRNDLGAALRQACDALKRSAADITPVQGSGSLTHARVL